MDGTCRVAGVGWDQGHAPFCQGTSRLPFKANANRRYHIPRQQYRVTNWPAYEAGLRARGSLTIWFTAEAIEGWRAERRTTRGGQPRYSALAISTALTLRAVFRLALRQTEGLIASIIGLLGLMGSEFWPRTPEGRILCFLLAIYGFAVFGYITASFASFFVGHDAASGDAETVGAADLARLSEEIAALRRELAVRP